MIDENDAKSERKHIVAWLLVCFPVGIYRMWKARVFSAKTRLLLTGLCILILAQALTQPQDFSPSNVRNATAAEPSLRISTTQQEAQERRDDAAGERVRVKFTNGIFVSSKVDREEGLAVLTVVANESQWDALETRHQHRLTKSLWDECRKAFVPKTTGCRVKILGLRDRALASISSGGKVSVGK